MNKIAKGILIRTLPLTRYPPESQKLMSNIIQDLEEKSYKIRVYAGSYSIVNNENLSIMKILCTIYSNYRIPGVGIGIFFRKELIDNKGLENINNLFPSLIIKNRFYMLGAGKYVDFYLTEIDSSKAYLDKKEEIFKILELLFNK